ncbi:MAG: hypothetical protein WCK15_17140 [Pirellula sp.]
MIEHHLNAAIELAIRAAASRPTKESVNCKSFLNSIVVPSEQETIFFDPEPCLVNPKHCCSKCWDIGSRKSFEQPVQFATVAGALETADRQLELSALPPFRRYFVSVNHL